ncbi:relaxase/mobilization nuclease domain-containing protein [Flaviaesturariibacter amylovorans]|uniref:Conjugal transfer protein MobB n=1 Tax=Flaviaesturariibacter amylovorans TaxID=1084520 RepID=A0ABP8HLR8_9BACT
MVARIGSSKNIQKVLNYNEQKVAKGRAVLLAAEGFLKDAGRLSFYDKWRAFQRLIELNERATTNAVHISLNFDPSESLSNEKMEAIAAAYMQGIGFGEQPYLVYRHEDAGHPHLHIVTTNICRDGGRISLHGLGRGPSEQVRKSLEQKFGLVPAQRKSNQEQAAVARKVVYGNDDLRRSIANVLQVVLPHYRFGSFPELNAILGLYRVQASRGAADSRTFKRGGLLYHALDEKGRPVGPPLKASILPQNPGLKYLEKRFAESIAQKVALQPRLRTKLDWALSSKDVRSWDSFCQALAKSGVEVVLRQNEEGFIYGVTYIDHQNKLVANGSELGKRYSPKGLGEQWGICGPANGPKPAESGHQKQALLHPYNEKKSDQLPATRSELLEVLLASEFTIEQQAAQGQKKRKKRKGRRPK